jgi:hypothetical protein
MKMFANYSQHEILSGSLSFPVLTSQNKKWKRTNSQQWWRNMFLCTTRIEMNEKKKKTDKRKIKQKEKGWKYNQTKTERNFQWRDFGGFFFTFWTKATN